MADDKKESTKSATPGDAANVKRPYATLDLKATEIKVTPISEKSSQAIAEDAARLAAAAMAGKSVKPGDVPLPAPASTYAEAVSAGTSASNGKADAKPQAAAPASPSTSAPRETPSKSAAAPAAAMSAPVEKVVVQKRGGFFSHLAAGIIGGALALSASEWALPQLGIHGSTSRLADDTAAIAQRLQAIEKKSTTPAGSDATASLDARLAAVESAAKQIPALSESQSRLVADTKAALASAASDSGAPEFIDRLAKLETQFKALSDAGANDPNSGRLAQLAALTGKVSDLETSLQTQLTALRKSVSDDVEARITSATESSEAAKSGTQRIDRDVAGVKSETARLAERIQALKLDSDRLTENLKIAQDETRALKASLDAAKSEAAKPADITAAVAPVTQKISSLEKSVDSVVKAEDDRRTNAERVLLSLELQNLKRVIERGQKYSAELADVQKVSGGKVDLSALDKYKDQGVPTLPELSKDFRDVANKAIDADAEPVEGGVVDRLLAGAKSVVRVRKVNHDPDDKSTEAVVGRMELALNEGRFGDLLSDAKGLSPKAEAAAKPFLDKVAAKASVDTAVAALENQLKSSLNAGAEAAPKATQ